jgi:uncharacterized membrane protein YfcA
LWEILLPLFGFLVGVAASLVGIGGGTFMVPILLIVYGFSPTQLATGTSLTVIIFTAIASTVNYWRQKRIYFKTGLVLAATTAPGAVLGSFLADILPSDTLAFIFGFFLMFMAARIMIDLNRLRSKSQSLQDNSEQRAIKSDAEILMTRKTVAWGTGLSFFGGLTAGLLGIGGGVLVVPIMMFAVGMPIHIATATSIFTMIFTSSAAVPKYYVVGRINLEYALLLAAGSIVGSQLGAYTSKRVSGKNLRRIFAVILIIVGLKMLLDNRMVLGF